MFDNDKSQACKAERSSAIALNLSFLLLGGGIGAAIALLFAPKPGREIRRSIKDAVETRYDKAVDTVNRVQEKVGDYYDTAKATGHRALETASQEVSNLKDEVSDDARKVSEMVSKAAKRVAETVR